MSDKLVKRLLRKPLTSSLSGAFGLAALLMNSSALGAECNGKYAFLSEDYLYSKADCAIDAAIKGGVSALTDAAKSIVAMGINSYVPGLGSLLLGGGKDSLTVQADRICKEIDNAKREIIREIFEQQIRQGQVTLDTVLTDLEDFADDDFATKVTNFGRYSDIWVTLEDQRIDSQTPQKNGGSLTVEDLQRFHTVMFIAGLQYNISPVLAAIANRITYPTMLPADALNLSTQEARSDLRLMLEGNAAGMSEYLNEIDENDLFWKASAGKVSAIAEHQDVAYDQYAGNHTDYTWSWNVPGVGSYAVKYSKTGADWPYWVTSFKGPGGVVLSPPNYKMTQQQAHAFASAEHEKQLRSIYEEFLLETYGPARVAMDSWYREVGIDPPRRTFDDELDAVIRDRAVEYFEKVGIGWSTLGSFCNGGWTYLDERQFYDLILIKGTDYVVRSLWAAGQADPLAGAPPTPTYPASVLSNLYQDVSDPWAYFSGQFAAKVVALTL